MRELKFRAWDLRDRRYGEVRRIEYNLDGEVDTIVCWFNVNEREVYLAKGTYVLEQYTGLKDKNDKEICEGDIVMARWYRAKNARLDTKGEIKFDDGWFYIYDDPDGQDRLGVPIHNCYNIEVIGNIHENKELLEGE